MLGQYRRRWPSIDTTSDITDSQTLNVMLDHRRWRWVNIKTLILGEFFVLAPKALWRLVWLFFQSKRRPILFQHPRSNIELFYLSEKIRIDTHHSNQWKLLKPQVLKQFGSLYWWNPDNITLLSLYVRIWRLCQNLTSTDVRFWRLTSIPALKDLKYF